MTELTLEVGKYYRTESGEKRGPAQYDYDDCEGPPWNVPPAGKEFHWYSSNGKSCVRPLYDLVAEWVDEPEEPKPWGELTDAEKGALLLADFNGEYIEFWYNEEPGWQDCIGGQSPGKTESFAYRRKPEPKRETVTLYGGGKSDMVWCTDRRGDDIDTHRITFDTIDGVPDCSTVRMEEIQ